MRSYKRVSFSRKYDRLDKITYENFEYVYNGGDCRGCRSVGILPSSNKYSYKCIDYWEKIREYRDFSKLSLVINPQEFDLESEGIKYYILEDKKRVVISKKDFFKLKRMSLDEQLLFNRRDGYLLGIGNLVEGNYYSFYGCLEKAIKKKTLELFLNEYYCFCEIINKEEYNRVYSWVRDYEENLQDVEFEINCLQYSRYKVNPLGSNYFYNDEYLLPNPYIGKFKEYIENYKSKVLLDWSYFSIRRAREDVKSYMDAIIDRNIGKFNEEAYNNLIITRNKMMEDHEKFEYYKSILISLTKKKEKDKYYSF